MPMTALHVEALWRCTSTALPGKLLATPLEAGAGGVAQTALRV